MPALVQRPAPTFAAEAVVEGTFSTVNLQDYLGQWYAPKAFYHMRHIYLLVLQGRPPFLPNVGANSIATCHGLDVDYVNCHFKPQGLHLCLPDVRVFSPLKWKFI